MVSLQQKVKVTQGILLSHRVGVDHRLNMHQMASGAFTTKSEWRRCGVEGNLNISSDFEKVSCDMLVIDELVVVGVIDLIHLA